jgi:ATP-dependent exoDNAse (exonuclease V) alpha subunit
LFKNTPLALGHEFKAILNQLETTSEHFFITGRAGTGKSTLLNLFRNTTKKRAAVLAPTGIAALNVKGQTIHSFFGFPPRMINKTDIEKRKNFKLFVNLECIIIDEISMVRADMIDNIDTFLRKNRSVNAPFGGVQMIFFGDLFQLPPVLGSDFERQYFKLYYDSPYFFSAQVFQNKLEGFSLKMIELQTVYRQSERFFINILDNIRTGEVEEDDFYTLNERYVDLPEDTRYFIYLCSVNATADSINRIELDKIKEPTLTYQAKIDGEFAPQLFPTESILTLKKGAQVMFIKNDVDRKYVNGSIGIVTELEKDVISVSIMDDEGEEKIFKVFYEEWEIIKYNIKDKDVKNIETTIVGRFNQLPVRLAWAITIHKSQGKTFEKVIIDMGRGAFDFGQTYVALSRCKTLEGIYLRKPLRGRDIMVDQSIVEYYDMMRRYF